MNLSPSFPPRERWPHKLDTFLALLRGEKLPRTVWTGDLDYWLTGQRVARTLRPEWDTTEGRLQLHRDLGLFPYIVDYDAFWAATPRYDPGVELHVQTDGDATTRRIRTPRGELCETSVFSRASCSTAVTRYAVSSRADLETLVDLIERRRLEPANLDDYPQRAGLWRRYDGLPCLGLPRSPLSAFCYEWAGLQNAAFLIADHEPLVRELFAMMEAQEAPILEAIARLRPPLVHFPDNLSSQNLTGWYNEWLGPWHRRRIERLHAAGVRCAVHLDGTVRGLLPKLAAVGFDAIEAVTPKPGGDLSVEDVASLAVQAADKVGWSGILWGGVPGVLFAPPFTWEDMQSHVRRVLNAWGRRPFVLGIADQIPPDGNIDFCRRIADMVGQ
jgi:hypothetical protein